MTDRELLEMAAKAAGLAIKANVVDEQENLIGFRLKISKQIWNPLTEDADAFRLSVALGMSVSSCILYRSASTINLSLAGIFIKEEMAYQSCEAACRRAIVRAAAEIGRRMP